MAGSAIAGTVRSGSGSGPWGVKGLPVDFEADAVDASFPDFSPALEGGAAVAVGVVLDGATPPDTLDIKILDVDGIDLLAGAGAIVTTSRRLPISPPAPFTGRLTITVGGNTQVGARAKIIPYIL